MLIIFGFYQKNYDKTLSEIYQQALRFYTSGDDKEAYLAFIELLEDKPPSSLYFMDHDMARQAYGFLSRRTKNREKKQSYLKNTIKHMGFIDQVEPIDTAWQKRIITPILP